MKAIEVKKGDKVIYKETICTVINCMLNKVVIKCLKYGQIKVGYSQIDKYEQ